MPSVYGLVNDVLIALSARSIGASVITQNERDFAAIQSVRPFKLLVKSLTNTKNWMYRADEKIDGRMKKA